MIFDSKQIVECSLASPCAYAFLIISWQPPVGFDVGALRKKKASEAKRRGKKSSKEAARKSSNLAEDISEVGDCLSVIIGRIILWYLRRKMSEIFHKFDPICHNCSNGLYLVKSEFINRRLWRFFRAKLDEDFRLDSFVWNKGMSSNSPFFEKFRSLRVKLRRMAKLNWLKF